MNVSSWTPQGPFHFFGSNIPRLTSQQKRSGLIALAIISLVVTVYYTLSHYFKKTEPSGNPQIKAIALNAPQKSVIKPSYMTLPQPTSGVFPQKMAELEEEVDQRYQQAIETFSFEVLRHKVQEGLGDLLISPIAIFFLLSMIKGGIEPKDPLQKEFKDIVHLPTNSVELNLGAFHLIQKLKTSGLDIASLLYLNPEYCLNPYYQAQTSQHYESLVESGSSAEEVNAWAKTATHGQIPEVITQKDLDDFFLVLANAMHFKGEWDVPFDAQNTTLDSFIVPNMSVDSIRLVRVPTMHMTSQVQYFENEHCQAIDLLYRDKKMFSMRLILPKKMNDFSFIDGDCLQAISEGMQLQIVKISLPKFKIAQELDVLQMLRELGISDRLVKPDFSPLVDVTHFASKEALPRLKISKITQKSILACDEEGTEASTVTVAKMILESCLSSDKTYEKEIMFDRPFLATLMLDRKMPVMLSIVRNSEVV